MVASRMIQLETTLENWANWSSQLNHKPVLLKTLSGGRSNRSLLLDSDLGKLVLRLNSHNSLLPGETRDHEAQIWQAASRCGIAPPLIFSDEQAGYLVNTYIDNKLPADPSTNKGLAIQALDLLTRCHQLKVRAPTIDYANHIERYWASIENKNIAINPRLAAQREPMSAVLESLLNSGTTIGLCHHDPVVANFVGGPARLYLIDWEYAANGMQVMDYAALGIEWGLDDETIIEHTGTKAPLLSVAKKLYGYICDLWEAQKNPGTSPG